MGNCLVTTLKEVVQNENLDILGEGIVTFKISSGKAFSGNCKSTTGNGYTITPVGEGVYLKDKNENTVDSLNVQGTSLVDFSLFNPNGISSPGLKISNKYVIGLLGCNSRNNANSYLGRIRLDSLKNYFIIGTFIPTAASNICYYGTEEDFLYFVNKGTDIRYRNIEFSDEKKHFSTIKQALLSTPDQFIQIGDSSIMEDSVVDLVGCHPANNFSFGSYITLAETITESTINSLADVFKDCPVFNAVRFGSNSRPQVIDVSWYKTWTLFSGTLDLHNNNEANLRSVEGSLESFVKGQCSTRTSGSMSIDLRNTFATFKDSLITTVINIEYTSTGAILKDTANVEISTYNKSSDTWT